MSVERSPALDAVLCVTVDNSPIAGTYLSDPGAQSAEVLSQPGVAKSPSVKTVGTRPASSGSTATAFDVGSPIPAGFLIGGLRRHAYGGSWTLPARGTGGACTLADGGSNARFRMDSGPATCTVSRVLDAQGQTCEALGSARYLGELVLGWAPSAILGSFLPVTVASVRTMNPSTGEISLGSGANLASVWTAGTCTCTGAVAAVSYSVRYDAATQTIIGVAADVLVMTLSQPLASCGTVPVTLPLTLGISYTATGLSGAGYAANAAALQGRSGGPGYLTGAPVLAGALISQSGQNPLGSAPLATSDKLAVGQGVPPGHMSVFAAQVQAGRTNGYALAGLKVRGPSPTGACVPFDPAAPVGTDAAMAIPVLFGQDLSISCALQLDRDALAALCGTGAAAAGTMQALLGLSPVNASSTSPSAAVTHIGTLGNSDPWKAWQWTRVGVTAATPTAAWDGTRGVCSGLLAGMDVEFLYTRVGEASNPQRKILAVRVSYPTDTWTFAREDVRTARDASGATGRQTFLVKTTVTWSEWKPIRAVDYIPPAPPLIPPMPNDLWYPFETASGAEDGAFVVSGTQAGASVGVLAVAAALVAVAVAWRQGSA